MQCEKHRYFTLVSIFPDPASVSPVLSIWYRCRPILSSSRKRIFKTSLLLFFQSNPAADPDLELKGGLGTSRI